MAHVATIPAAADLLCEGCGYVLNGLPADGRCPECGKPVTESAATLRRPPPWELGRAGGNVVARFLSTTAAAIFRPTHFFRHLSINRVGASRYFARLHWVFAAALLGVATVKHLYWSYGVTANDWFAPYGLIILVVLCYGALAFVNRLAARLTAWEAAYRGIRLPLPVVERGLEYHAPHYLPVALLIAAIIFGYQFLLRRDAYAATMRGTTYLYVLSGAVVASAVYLFWTYWIAMRNMMYANR